MPRILAVVAAAGLLLCAGFFALAFLVAGDRIFSDDKPFAAIEPLIDRATFKQWRWNGGDTLVVNTPMVLHYQPEGLPHVTVTGPAGSLGDVQVGGGQIGAPQEAHRDRRAKLDAVVSGVAIRKFMINGNQQLDLGHIDQEALDVRIQGNGSVSADGKVGQLNLVIAGNGNAALGGLSVQTAKVAILGQGDATLAPHQSLYLTIAGHGMVYLKSHPASIQKTIIGSGQVIEEDGQTGSAQAGSSQGNAGQAVASATVPSGVMSTGGNRNFLISGSGSQDLGHLDGGEVKILITSFRLGPRRRQGGPADRDGVRLRQGQAGRPYGARSGRHRRGQRQCRHRAPGRSACDYPGSGNVYLASRPRRIERSIMGSGRIIEQD